MASRRLIERDAFTPDLLSIQRRVFLPGHQPTIDFHFRTLHPPKYTCNSRVRGIATIPNSDQAIQVRQSSSVEDQPSSANVRLKASMEVGRVKLVVTLTGGALIYYLVKKSGERK